MFVNIDFVAIALVDANGDVRLTVNMPGMNNGYRMVTVRGEDAADAMRALAAHAPGAVP